MLKCSILIKETGIQDFMFFSPINYVLRLPSLLSTKNNKDFSSLGCVTCSLHHPAFSFQGTEQGCSKGKQTAELTL